ncbi:MAG: hypothetical protein HLUCCA08_04115 [Rhodobacteraceae bacterium HLUCCA08]|nr:MAG: hypothetical protein HLUCCA08_04115 [Rhodobacteraceae bacterium HLUCCA08]
MYMKAVLLGLGMLALAGCETAPATGSAGGSVSAQIESFIEDAATAELIASECPDLSMTASTETLTTTFVNQMIASGVSPVVIAEAVDGLDDYAMAGQIVSDLLRAGVDPSNATSMCGYGRQQITTGSRVGRFLR